MDFLALTKICRPKDLQVFQSYKGDWIALSPVRKRGQGALGQSLVSWRLSFQLMCQEIRAPPRAFPTICRVSFSHRIGTCICLSWNAGTVESACSSVQGAVLVRRPMAFLNKCKQVPQTLISDMLSWVANIYFSLLIKEKTHSTWWGVWRHCWRCTRSRDDLRWT